MPIGVPARSASSLSLSLSPVPPASSVAPDNFSKKSYCVGVLNSLSKNREHNGVINSVKEFTHIALKDVARACVVSGNLTKHTFSSKHSSVCSFANTTGERVDNESRLENGINNLKDCVMQNPVSNSRLMNVPPFRVVDVEVSVTSVSIGLIFQITMEFKDILFQIFLKIHNIKFVSLATLKLVPSQKEVFWIDYFIK